MSALGSEPATVVIGLDGEELVACEADVPPPRAVDIASGSFAYWDLSLGSQASGSKAQARSVLARGAEARA